MADVFNWRKPPPESSPPKLTPEDLPWVVDAMKRYLVSAEELTNGTITNGSFADDLLKDEYYDSVAKLANAAVCALPTLIGFLDLIVQAHIKPSLFQCFTCRDLHPRHCGWVVLALELAEPYAHLAPL